MVVVNEKINSSFPMHFHTRCQNIKLVLKTKLETVIQCLYFGFNLLYFDPSGPLLDHPPKYFTSQDYN